MPGKSRNKRGKYSPQNRTGKSRSGQPDVPAQPSAVAESGAVASPKIARPLVSKPSSVGKSPVVHHGNIATELRTIGILTGVMLVILIVLARIMS
ncbi:MAG: hypothetical protein HW402_608 [Dehalococcoidales bacterium]|nr:hypothetical protein [Dehalococcoidales bacterium]